MPATKDENKNGLWRYQKVVYHPVTSERIVLRKRGFSSKKEAEIAEAVAISEIIGYKGESKLLFEEVIREYLKYKSKRVNSRTLEKLERLFDGFIIPVVKAKIWLNSRTEMRLSSMINCWNILKVLIIGIKLLS